MNVLTVATLKGGNAKTTTCLALAAALAEKGHAIALVDADPQATATMIFGLRPVAEPWRAEPVELHLEGLRAGSITLIRGGRMLRLAGATERAAFFALRDVRAEGDARQPPGSLAHRVGNGSLVDIDVCAGTVDTVVPLRCRLLVRQIDRSRNESATMPLVGACTKTSSSFEWVLRWWQATNREVVAPMNESWLTGAMT